MFSWAGTPLQCLDSTEYTQSAGDTTRLLNAVRKTNTHYLGQDCTAIETQMVSMSLLYKVQ